MLFSDRFRVSRLSEDDWFDPILDADTRLFVDPFAIFKEAGGFWAGSHEKIIDHFNLCFRLVAEGSMNPRSIGYQKAVGLLTFLEPKELCLGYTQRGTSGAGAGRGFAESMASLIAESIRRGVKDIRHFEELGIFKKGIGADRISDMTCNILKSALVAYTQQVVQRHHISVERHQLRNGAYDSTRDRWRDAPVDLPTNPVNGRPILLVPERFLDQLPELNADDWWAAYENEQLRTDLSYEVLGKVDKETIVAAARRNPDLVRNWTIRKEGEPAHPYDLDTDPAGLYRWDPESRAFVEHNPLVLDPPQTEEEFVRLIEFVIARFKLFVEEQGGWALLWDRAHDKPESAAQLLFRGIAKHYCEANNVVLDAEVNLGRGPVDFKFSNGYQRRAHLEVKKLHNGKFWNGLEGQLPSYLTSDEVQDGWFVVVRYRSGKPQDRRATELPKRVSAAAVRTNKRLRYSIVDARPKQSASRL